MTPHFASLPSSKGVAPNATSPRTRSSSRANRTWLRLLFEAQLAAYSPSAPDQPSKGWTFWCWKTECETFSFFFSLFFFSFLFASSLNWVRMDYVFAFYPSLFFPFQYPSLSEKELSSRSAIFRVANQLIYDTSITQIPTVHLLSTFPR